MFVAAQVTRMVCRILKRHAEFPALGLHPPSLPVTQANTNLGVAVKGICDVVKVSYPLIL